MHNFNELYDQTVIKKFIDALGKGGNFMKFSILGCEIYETHEADVIREQMASLYSPPMNYQGQVEFIYDQELEEEKLEDEAEDSEFQRVILMFDEIKDWVALQQGGDGPHIFLCHDGLFFLKKNQKKFPKLFKKKAEI